MPTLTTGLGGWIPGVNLYKFYPIKLTLILHLPSELV